MLIISVHLASARTGRVTEIARMHIANDGTGTGHLHNYTGRTLRGRSREALDLNVIQRTGNVEQYSRSAVHVWNLIARMLTAMGYH